MPKYPSPVFDLEHVFTFHQATPEQIFAYERIRESARVFAADILASAPGCADRTDAIRKVREAVMIANAAIALDGRLYKPAEPGTYPDPPEGKPDPEAEVTLGDPDYATDENPPDPDFEVKGPLEPGDEGYAAPLTDDLAEEGRDPALTVSDQIEAPDVAELEIQHTEGAAPDLMLKIGTPNTTRRDQAQAAWISTWNYKSEAAAEDARCEALLIKPRVLRTQVRAIPLPQAEPTP